MKAELLRSIVAAGEARKVGDVVELSESEYQFLENRGLVKAITEEEKKKTVPKKAKESI